MVFRLALASESYWRKVNAPHLVALVREGVRYQDDVHVSMPDVREQVQEQLRFGDRRLIWPNPQHLTISRPAVGSPLRTRGCYLCPDTMCNLCVTL